MRILTFIQIAAIMYLMIAFYPHARDGAADLVHDITHTKGH